MILNFISILKFLLKMFQGENWSFETKTAQCIGIKLVTVYLPAKIISLGLEIKTNPKNPHSALHILRFPENLSAGNTSVSFVREKHTRKIEI